jgi:drug/metabolite transporter (DMT)-like permease
MDEHTHVPSSADEVVSLPRPLARGRPLVGYALVLIGAFFGGVNATVAKVTIVSGDVSAVRLAQLRAVAAAVLLLAGLALGRRHGILPARRQLPFLVAFGVVGLALAQSSYFLSIERLEIGVALLMVNIAIVFVAAWGRFVGSEEADTRLWLAIVLALAGLALVVEAWRGAKLDALGVAAALVAALTYSTYILLADRNARRGGSASVFVAWGFVFASLFWAIVQPWWTFPFQRLDDRVSLLGRLGPHDGPVWLLLLYVVPFGTVGVFVLYAAALRYISPTHVMLVGVLEPVFGTVVAFAWLGETLAPPQIAGGILVVSALLLAQSARVRTRAEPPQPPP